MKAQRQINHKRFWLTLFEISRAFFEQINTQRNWLQSNTIDYDNDFDFEIDYGQNELYSLVGSTEQNAIKIEKKEEKIRTIQEKIIYTIEIYK